MKFRVESEIVTLNKLYIQSVFLFLLTSGTSGYSLSLSHLISPLVLSTQASLTQLTVFKFPHFSITSILFTPTLASVKT